MFGNFSLNARTTGDKSGYYSGQYDAQKEELILKSNSTSKEKKNKIFSGSVTLEQLLVIVTMVQRDRGDKFTPDEIEIIKKIKRPTPKSFRGSRLFPAHHIIPKDVCQNSNFIVQATKLTEFYVNHGMGLIAYHCHVIFILALIRITRTL